MRRPETGRHHLRDGSEFGTESSHVAIEQQTQEFSRSGSGPCRLVNQLHWAALEVFDPPYLRKVTRAVIENLREVVHKDRYCQALIVRNCTRPGSSGCAYTWAPNRRLEESRVPPMLMLSPHCLARYVST